MAASVVCPACKKVVQAPDELIGRTMACPWCKTVVFIPLRALPIPGLPDVEDDPDYDPMGDMRSDEDYSSRRRRQRQLKEGRPRGGGRTTALQVELGKGERITHAAQLHWFIFVRPAFLLVPAILVGASFQIRAARETDFLQAHINGIVAGVLFYLGGVTAAAQWVVALLRWKFTEFCVTNQRVLIREGQLYHKSVGIPLDDVGMLTIRKGLVGRRVGYGTLRLRSKQGLQKIRDIRDPLEFYDQVRAAAVAAKRLQTRGANDPGKS